MAPVADGAGDALGRFALRTAAWLATVVEPKAQFHQAHDYSCSPLAKGIRSVSCALLDEKEEERKQRKFVVVDARFCPK